MKLSPQAAFDFGTSHLAENDPIYSTDLYRRVKARRDFYGTLTAKRQWRLIMERDGWRCKACGQRHCSEVRLHVDHIIPVGAGGDDFCLTNQQALCPRCHALKTSMDALRYGWTRARFG